MNNKQGKLKGGEGMGKKERGREKQDRTKD